MMLRATSFRWKGIASLSRTIQTLPICSTAVIYQSHSRMFILINMEGRRGHEYLRWNSEVQHWFCIACGRTSDHQSLTDAKVEIEQHDCELPFVKNTGGFHDPDRR